MIESTNQKTDLRVCWYRLRYRPMTGPSKPLPPRLGRLHLFTTDFVEFTDGPGNYPVAIVEDEETGTVHSVPVEDVCFGTSQKFAKD